MDLEELEFKLSSWRKTESYLLVIILNQTKIENTYRTKKKLYYIKNVSFTYFVKYSKKFDLANSRKVYWFKMSCDDGDDDVDDGGNDD